MDLFKDISIEDNFDVEIFLNIIRERIKEKNGWKVLRYAAIGPYPFNGIELYNDLDPSNIDFSQFDVLSRLFSKTDTEGNEVSYDSYDENDIERLGEKLVPKIVLDADSSQFLALMNIANNKNLAIEGPPGSGKSQTIVNLIASAINQNKKVLFVAQKGTALEVVLSRLTALNLDQLVLPLMGRKTDKEQFYNALMERLSLQKPKEIFYRDNEAVKEQIIEKKIKINGYITAIKKEVPHTDLTVHDVLGLSIKYNNDISALTANEKQITFNLSRKKDLVDSTSIKIKIDNDSIEVIKDKADEFSRRYKSLDIAPHSYWSKYYDGVDNYQYIEQIKSYAIDSKKILDETLIAFELSIDEIPDIIYPLGKDNISPILEGIVSLERNQTHIEDILGAPNLAEDLNDLEQIFLRRQNLSSKSNISWKDLLRLVASQDEIKFIESKDYLDCFGVDKTKFEGIKNNLISNTEKLSEVIELKNILKASFGLNDITINALKLLKEVNSKHTIFNEDNICTDIALNGFSSLLAAIKLSEKILADFDDLEINVKDLPPRRELLEVHSGIESAGFFSFLSGKYQNYKQQTIAILGIPAHRYDRHQAKSSLSIAIEINKKWDTSEAKDLLGDIQNLDKNKIKEIANKISEIILEADRLKLNSSNFYNLFSPQLMNFISTVSIDLKHIGYGETWHTLQLKRDALKEDINQLEELLAEDNNDLFEVLKNNELNTTKRISWLLKELGSVNVLQKNLELAKESFSKKISFDIPDNLQFEKFLMEVTPSLNFFSTFSYFFNKSSNPKYSYDDVKRILDKLNFYRQSIAKLHSKFLLNGDKDLLPNSIIEEYETLSLTIDNVNGSADTLQKAILLKEIDEWGIGHAFASLRASDKFEEIGRVVRAMIVNFLTLQVYEKHGKALSEYTGQRLSDLRSEYQSLEKRLLQSNSEIIRGDSIGNSKPIQGIGYGKRSEYTEMSLIDHQLGLKRRISPPKLIKKSFQSLIQLHPCWMMVPTSVASFLPREQIFDLVVIDEASQMTPENSISALMRAKQAVIVGDTNQLPPTNFYKSTISNDDGDEDEDMVTLEESILELANNAFHPKHRLSWHYRSKHEALINFSNHYIYNNDLVIFPSTGQSAASMGVELVRVDGTYQGKINPSEAKSIANAIIDFMTNDAERSLGVVTMNQPQMELIESIVLRHADNNKNVRDYISYWEGKDEGLQRFFVKNIENVQGDERDVIFISTVYGKDSDGRFMQRLGPVNQVGGKRRLNVLFTRAKEQIKTFTSIPLDQFDSTNDGAVLLKRWLEYSATGMLGERFRESNSSRGPDSPFEEHVIEQIESLGYEAVPQVGVSNYFIDIGIRHPDYDLGYICGVECDGATYHSSKSARDRDFLRQEVLEGLGWNLYRIWSTDWFRDPHGQTELIKTYLDAKLEELKLAADELKFRVPDNSIPNENSVQNNISAHTDQDISGTEELKEVKEFSRVVVRYKKGLREGIESKFFISSNDNENKSYKDYSLLPSHAPLAEALLGAFKGEIVSFKTKDAKVEVQIIEVIG